MTQIDNIIHLSFRETRARCIVTPKKQRLRFLPKIKIKLLVGIKKRKTKKNENGFTSSFVVYTKMKNEVIPSSLYMMIFITSYRSCNRLRIVHCTPCRNVSFIQFQSSVTNYSRLHFYNLIYDMYTVFDDILQVSHNFMKEYFFRSQLLFLAPFDGCK